MQKRSYRGNSQNGYHVEDAPETPASSLPTDEEEARDKRKTLNTIRILVGVAVILVSAALLVALVSWVRQDIQSSVLFIQSEIR